MKLRKLALAPIAAAVMAFGVVSPAIATGETWSLSYSGSALPDDDTSHETYRITLGVDTVGYTGDGSFLDQVALRVSNSLFSASLFSAPGSPSDWALQAGGINSSGCSGSGDGFECANSLSALNLGYGVAINPANGVGVDYSWVFDLTMDNGALITSSPGAVKARFVADDGTKVDNVGEISVPLITTIPEPGTYAMMLAGLGLMGFVARRRRGANTAA